MPYFKKATINLGNRQLGRLQSLSILNAEIKKNLILNSLKKINTKNFKKKLKNNKNIYGKPGASNRIVKIIKRLKFENLFQKKFYDI